jgi:diaminohydroxyphosphoribosylaminopyrimidine deaminase/5-amino-6-(5-phosphoribosylamino)uracil reductase
MRWAIALSGKCPPSNGAYSVGAVIVDADGVELASGFSREVGSQVHAEEVALAKVGDRERLSGATLYSTLEPCSERKSSQRACAELIVASGIRRVVIAWREPGLFVPDCQGVELLTAAGVSVVELAEFAAEARAVNAHLAIGQGL